MEGAGAGRGCGACLLEQARAGHTAVVTMTSEPGQATPASATPRRGLVLGAGGVLGAAWTIGALQALQETLGWDPRLGEVVVGTSAGSVLAASLGSGVGVDTLVNHQRGVVVPGDPHIDYDHDADSGGALPPLPRPGLGSPGLLRTALLHPRRLPPTAALASVLPQGRGSLEPVGRLVDAIAPPEWPDQPRTWIVAMDYASGKRTVFGREGSPPARLRDAVVASCAIPGWYAPVRIGRRRYVDGGTLSSTSLDLVAPLELDEVYVLAPMVSFSLDHPDSMAARFERRYRRAITRRLEHEAVKVRAAGTRVVMLGPGPADLAAIGANLMDPRRRNAVFRTSVRTSAAALRRAVATAGPRAGFAAAG